MSEENVKLFERGTDALERSLEQGEFVWADRLLA
jgi:hypothetical protein